MAFKFNTLVTILLITLLYPVVAIGDGVHESLSDKEEVRQDSKVAKVVNDQASAKDYITGDRKAGPEKKLPPYSLSDQNLMKYQYCGKDSDCIQVVNGCCQCMQGDPVTSINKKYISEFERKFNCEGVKCPLDSLTHRCMDGVVSCIKFRCTYFPPE